MNPYDTVKSTVLALDIPAVMRYGVSRNDSRDTETQEDTAMATRQILIDDLTGSDDDVQQVSFTMSGQTYTLDLGVASRARLAELLQPFIDHARANRAARSVASHRRARTGHSAGETAALRHWARSNGFTIGDRGRIPQNIRDAYTLSQQQSA